MQVFVYGTLKRGYGNHRLLENQKFLGEAITADRFNMIAGGFPVIFYADDGLQLKGEVYDIGDPVNEEVLHDLDRLEGEGHMYLRETIPVIMTGGVETTCSAYIGHEEFWARSMDTPMNARFINDDGVLEWQR